MSIPDEDVLRHNKRVAVAWVLFCGLVPPVALGVILGAPFVAFLVGVPLLVAILCAAVAVGFRLVHSNRGHDNK